VGKGRGEDGGRLTANERSRKGEGKRLRGEKKKNSTSSGGVSPYRRGNGREIIGNRKKGGEKKRIKKRRK